MIARLEEEERVLEIDFVLFVRQVDGKYGVIGWVRNRARSQVVRFLISDPFLCSFCSFSFSPSPFLER